MSVWHTHRWKEHARTWAPPSGGGFRRADHLQGVVGRVRAADVRRHHDSLSVWGRPVRRAETGRDAGPAGVL